MSAAPGDDETNAKKRAPTSSGPEPIGSWKTTMPPKIAMRLAVTEGSGMTSTPLPIWRLRAETWKASRPAISAVLAAPGRQVEGFPPRHALAQLLFAFDLRIQLRAEQQRDVGEP